jgi:hypothetical protein
MGKLLFCLTMLEFHLPGSMSNSKRVGHVRLKPISYSSSVITNEDSRITIDFTGTLASHCNAKNPVTKMGVKGRI